MLTRATVVLVTFIWLVVAAVPVAASAPRAAAPEAPDVSAAAYLVYDADSGAVILSHRAFEPRPMASVTKLMTALVVVEAVALDETVTISDRAAATGEAEIDLVVGEQWTVRELLSAIMVRSANDAASALAEHVGGSIEGFVDMMNARARRLGLSNTRFANPHGLDDADHFTSAVDLLHLTLEAMQDPVLAQLAMTRVVKFRPSPDGQQRMAINTNELLGVFPGVVGTKTGFTSKAGRVLTSVATRGPRTIYVVVMGAEDHFADTRELVEFGFATGGFYDRIRRAAVEEEGGGGVIAPVAVPAQLRSRLAALAPLAAGNQIITPTGETPRGKAVTAWIERRVPVVLGGRR